MIRHKEHKKHETTPAPEATTPVEAAASAPVAPDSPPVSETVLAPGEEKLNALMQENKTLTERLLRLQADFDNYRKRVARERNDLYVMAGEELMRGLLPVLDNAYLSIQASAAQVDNPVVAGFKLVADELMTVLSRFGLQVIEPVSGEFDPQRHEAITVLPSNDIPENHVLQLFRRGYQLKDKLLRAAQVVVSGGVAQPVPAEPGSMSPAPESLAEPGFEERKEV